jgi:hypothetical protein
MPSGAGRRRYWNRHKIPKTCHSTQRLPPPRTAAPADVCDLDRIERIGAGAGGGSIMAFSRHEDRDMRTGVCVGGGEAAVRVGACDQSSN